MEAKLIRWKQQLAAYTPHSDDSSSIVQQNFPAQPKPTEEAIGSQVMWLDDVEPITCFLVYVYSATLLLTKFILCVIFVNNLLTFCDCLVIRQVLKKRRKHQLPPLNLKMRTRKISRHSLNQSRISWMASLPTSLNLTEMYLVRNPVHSYQEKTWRILSIQAKFQLSPCACTYGERNFIS